MNIAVAFDVGATVYTVVARKVMQHVTCAACTSTGKVSISGTEYNCPACSNRTESTGAVEQVALPLVISRVLVRKDSVETVVRYEGMRGGVAATVKESLLYATEAEALATIP